MLSKSVNCPEYFEFTVLNILSLQSSSYMTMFFTFVCTCEPVCVKMCVQEREKMGVGIKVERTPCHSCPIHE